MDGFANTVILNFQISQGSGAAYM